MDRGHQLAVGVKGNLRQTGILLPDLLLVKAEPLSQTHQRRLRGVAHLAALVHRGVAAQQGRPQQGLLHRVGKVRVLHQNDFSGGIELLNGHFILGQGAGFVGADHRNASQSLHRLQFADDGILPGHGPGAEGEHNGNDGAQRLRNGRHRQRHGE
ncbi:hypothetical protein SDC9_153074 [bioreactor metagenome]|uniref:Uncharacterized protein n=1 Tax=bioreactor metagenome TaxID=1076179 RepID=A0A645EWK2_9ZZZZ